MTSDDELVARPLEGLVEAWLCDGVILMSCLAESATSLPALTEEPEIRMPSPDVDRRRHYMQIARGGDDTGC